MEVRPGQRLSTIAQAMAHNTNTVRGDMDMLEKLCVARGHNHVIEQLHQALRYLDGAYHEFLQVFSDELERDLREHGDTPDPEYHRHAAERTAESVLATHDHSHPHIKGTDRQMIEQLPDYLRFKAEQAASRAEHYETR